MKLLVKNVSDNFVSKIISGNTSSVLYKLVYQHFSYNFDLRSFSVRVQLNLVPSLVSYDHDEDSVDVSILRFDIGKDVYKRLSFSELFTNSISGKFELIEVACADGPVDFVNNELDFLRHVLSISGDIGVADFCDSSFKEVRNNFSSGRSLTTCPPDSDVFFESRGGDKFEPDLLAESVLLVSSILSFSWDSFVFSFCHNLLRFIIKSNQNYRL